MILVHVSFMFKSAVEHDLSSLLFQNLLSILVLFNLNFFSAIFSFVYNMWRGWRAPRGVVHAEAWLWAGASTKCKEDENMRHSSSLDPQKLRRHEPREAWKHEGVTGVSDTRVREKGKLRVYSRECFNLLRGCPRGTQLPSLLDVQTSDGETQAGAHQPQSGDAAPSDAGKHAQRGGSTSRVSSESLFPRKCNLISN